MGMKPWLKGLGVAFISGLADAYILHMADPSHFNFTVEGLKMLGPAVVFKAMLAVALYLKRSPLPE